MIKRRLWCAVACWLLMGHAWGQEAVIMPPPPPPPGHPPDDFVRPATDDPHALFEACNGSPARFWLSADYLVWGIKPGPVAIPLLTTGRSGNARAGFLDEPSTRVLVGDGDIHYGTFGGFRLDGGWWFDSERTLGLNINGFATDQRIHAVVVGSEDNQGRPVLSRPIVNVAGGASGESVIDISYPHQLVGGFTASSASELGGLEVNLQGLAVNGPRLSVDLLGGFRYLNLNEDLFLTQDSTSLIPNRLSYTGFLQPDGSNVIANDYFCSTNRFYGGQLGAKVNWTMGRVNLGVTGKLALGSTQSVVHVDGDTTLVTPDGSLFSSRSGVLATSSNIGRHESWRFSMVPEVGLNLGWQLTHRLRLNVGYTFLYWTNVVRPGSVLDRTVDGGRIPSDPAFGLSNQNRPAFAPQTSDFWTQGLNVGLEFRF